MTRALAVTALLVVGGAALAGPERDYNQPPPGASPEDAKLWRELREGTSWALWQLARVAQCSARIRYGKYYELLDEKIQAGPADEATRAKALRATLEAAATDAQRAIPEDGGRVHACRITLLDYEQRIDPGNVEVAHERASFRSEAQACADRMGRLIARVAPAADGLERTLGEVDAFLKRSAPAVPASEPGPPAAPPPSTKAS